MSLEKIVKELQDARRLLELENARKMSIDSPLPYDALSEIGTLVGVIYQKGRKKYIHQFSKASQPKLAVTNDGKQLHIVGGQYVVTENGIEDDA